MNKVTVLLLLLIGLLQYRLWFGDGNVLEFQRLNDRITELRQEGAKRRERNAALEAEVMDLKQGLDAVEERARNDLGMIKEGEEFVQVIDPNRENDSQPAAPPEEQTTPANTKSATEKKAKDDKTQKAKPKLAKPPANESQPGSKEKPAGKTGAAKRPVPPQPAEKTVESPTAEPPATDDESDR